MIRYFINKDTKVCVEARSDSDPDKTSVVNQLNFPNMEEVTYFHYRLYKLMLKAEAAIK